MLFLIAKIIHVLAACVVIGYLVYDICIFSALKKSRPAAEFTRLKREVLRAAAAVSGVAFALVIASGIYLASVYFGGFGGEWLTLDGAFARLLWLKIAVVLSLFIFTPFSLFFVLRGKPDPFRQYYHEIALIICVAAVVIAQIMLS